MPGTRSTPLHLQPARKWHKQAATSYAIAVTGSCFHIRAADEGYMEVVKCLLEEGKAEATCEQPKPCSLPKRGVTG